ncbi:hypothetical protein D3C71_1834510 [compost metagenome]
MAVQRSGDFHVTQVTVPPNSRAVLEVEIGTADASRYRVTGPGSLLPVKVISDLTGTVLRIGPLGSGMTKVERTRS